MAGDTRDWTRRRADPLVAGISDGVVAGYQALEYVFEGLREAVVRRGGPGQGGPWQAYAHRGQPRGVTAPFDVVEDLATIFGELLGRAGEVAQETASSITERTWSPSRLDECALIQIGAVQGELGAGDFFVWNASAVMLKRVDLIATDLFGHGERIGADVVAFAPPHVDRLLPGRSTTVKVVVTVPGDAHPGTYRGLVQAKASDAWAVLELTVVEKQDNGPQAGGGPGAAQAAAPTESQTAEQEPPQAAEGPADARRARRTMSRWRDSD